MCRVLITIDDEKYEEEVTTHHFLNVPFFVFHQKSFVSVVFDFSASSSDVAPVPPMSLPVDLMRKELIADGCHLCVASFILTEQTELIQCCV